MTRSAQRFGNFIAPLRASSLERPGAEVVQRRMPPLEIRLQRDIVDRTTRPVRNQRTGANAALQTFTRTTRQ
jgi:hypothetical protein